MNGCRATDKRGRFVSGPGPRPTQTGTTLSVEIAGSECRGVHDARGIVESRPGGNGSRPNGNSERPLPGIAGNIQIVRGMGLIGIAGGISRRTVDVRLRRPQFLRKREHLDAHVIREDFIVGKVARIASRARRDDMVNIIALDRTAQLANYLPKIDLNNTEENEKVQLLTELQHLKNLITELIG